MTPVETIIFLQEREFSPRDYARFGVEALQRKGFRVEAWDISRVLHPDAAPPESSPASLPGGFLPVTFSRRRDVLGAFQAHGPSTLVILYVGYSLSTLFVYRALSRRRIPFAVTVTNALPLPERSTVTLGLDLPGKILSVILNTVLLRHYPLFGVRPASLLLVGGERSLNIGRYPLDPGGGRTAVLSIHTLDYDLYLGAREPAAQAGENIAVFLDSNDFYHLELRHLRVPVPGWVGAYFAELRHFFDTLERDLGVRVVIAAHPLARYTPEQLAEFGGREVIQGRTPDLVKRCRCAILHASTAVNLAVLFGKPLLVITDENYERYALGPYIEALARELGRRPIYLDRPLPKDWEKELVVDREAYLRYRRSYIKMDGSEEKPSWEILAGFLAERWTALPPP